MDRNLKFALGMFVPHSLATYTQRRIAQHKEIEYRQRFAARQNEQQQTRTTYSYDASVAQLVDWGLDPVQVAGGSIPVESLEMCARALSKHLPHNRPLVGLHVGNFVGVSLCFFLKWITQQHQGSRLVSIDPNIMHLGVENPQQYVTRLVQQFGLAPYHVLVVGYTLEKNVSQFDAFRPEENADNLNLLGGQAACENLLPNLAQLGVRADFIVIDGNHDATYLARELRAMQAMLAERALVLLDDVNEHWYEVRDLYESLVGEHQMSEVARDGRMGILLTGSYGRAG